MAGQSGQNADEKFHLHPMGMSADRRSYSDKAGSASNAKIFWH